MAHQWRQIHAQAWAMPLPGFERAIVSGCKALSEYRATHAARHCAPIGEDHFLGPVWLAWARAIRALLNGETGRLDCGTIDQFLCDEYLAAGFDYSAEPEL